MSKTVKPTHYTLPEGQDINLKLPLIETNESYNFTDIYFKVLDYYRNMLGKKTIVMYHNPNFPDIHNIVMNRELTYDNPDPEYDKVYRNEFLNLINQSNDSSGRPSNITRFCYSSRIKYDTTSNPNYINICNFIEMSVDYHDWNVIMMTWIHPVNDFKIDRVFLCKNKIESLKFIKHQREKFLCQTIQTLH